MKLSHFFFAMKLFAFAFMVITIGVSLWTWIFIPASLIFVGAFILIHFAFKWAEKHDL